MSDFSQEHADAIEAMKGQLLIVLLKRLGGNAVIPIAEIDATGQDLLLMSLDPVMRTFTFEVRKKS